MAENEAGNTAVAEAQGEEAFQYPVTIVEVTPGTKRISVEIPRERIDAKLAEQFKELRQQAHIPGFRHGHAPQKLIEKRFASDVRDQVRRSLIGESYEQAIEQNALKVLGEPEIENADKIELPEQGPLQYHFQVDVQPDFALPVLTGLKIRKPKIEIRDENVEQAMKNLREQQGALVPVEDRGVEPMDYLVADVHLKVDGNIVAHQHAANIVARPGIVGDLHVSDLDKQLEGLKPGEKRSFTVKAPDNHANEQIRGTDVEIEVALQDIKRMDLAEVSEAFLADLGFTSEAELRDALREQMQEKIDADVQQAMREQVNAYLLGSVHIQLPEKLSLKQEERVVGRRAVDLMMRGMSREQIAANLDKLRAGAAEEAARELKLFFILQQIAEDRRVDVSEGELNGRIATLAIQRGERPEKLKQSMSKDGTLSNMYIQMREQKAVDTILEAAQIEEVEIKSDGEIEAQTHGGEHAAAHDQSAHDHAAHDHGDQRSPEQPAQ